MLISSPIIACFTLLLTDFLVALGGGSMIAYTTLRGVDLGFATTEIGYIIAFYVTGGLCACLFSGHLIKRVGQIRSVAVYTNILCLTSILLSYSDTIIFWIILRFIQGFCIAAIYNICMSWLNEAVSENFRARIQALLYITHSSSLLIAAVIIRNYHEFHHDVSMMIALFFAVSLIPIAFTKIDQPAIPEKASIDVINVFRMSPTAIIICFVIGMLGSGLYQSIQIFGLETGLNTEDSVTLTMSYLAGSLILQYPFAYLSEKYDRRLIIIILLGLMIIPFIFLLGLSAILPFIFMFILFALIGGFADSSLVIGNAHGFDYAQPGSYLIVANTLTVIWSVGSIISPIIFTQAMAVYGAWSVPLICIIVVSAVIPYIAWRRTIRDPISSDSHISIDATTMVTAHKAQNASLEAIYQEDVYNDNSTDNADDTEDYPDDKAYIDAIETLQEKQQDI